MSKNIYRLLGARALSEFASSMYAIILPLIVLDLSGSLAHVGTFYSIVKLPSVVLLPFLGVFVDRYNRKKLLFTCGLLLAMLFVIQLLLFSNGNSSMGTLAVLGIASQLVSSVNDLASRVIFSEVVPPAFLQKYNGIKSVMDNGAMFIAPMLGTLLYGLVDTWLLMLLLALLYGGSALVIFFLKTIQTTHRDSNTEQSVGTLNALHAGCTYLFSQKTVLSFCVLATALNFFVASTEEIINPGILINKYTIPYNYFGLSSTFTIVGILLAGIFIARHPQMDFQQHLQTLFIANSAVMILIGGTSVLFQGRWSHVYYAIFLVLQVLLGFFTILVNVPLTSYFQATVPVHLQSRFFAFFSFAANLSTPFGLIYTGLLAERIGADVTYILNNSVVIVIVVCTYRRVSILGKVKQEP